MDLPGPVLTRDRNAGICILIRLLHCECQRRGRLAIVQIVRGCPEDRRGLPRNRTRNDAFEFDLSILASLGFDLAVGEGGEVGVGSKQHLNFDRGAVSLFLKVGVDVAGNLALFGLFAGLGFIDCHSPSQVGCGT